MSAHPLAPDWLVAPADANALAAGVWPRSAVRDADGALVVGGVSAAELVNAHGSPLYVVDEQEVRARARETVDAFTRESARIGSSATVYYASKAFLSAEVARWVTEAGMGLDVSTGGELALALAAGVDAGRLGLHGNNKSTAEIDRAVAAGIGTIILDGPGEVESVAEAARRHGRVQRVRLRVSSGVHAHTHDFLATAHDDQKFGVPVTAADEIVAGIRREASLEFVGLHCHIGSQIFDTAGFAESAARLLDVHARLSADGPVPELNLGGGFGIAYTDADRPTPIAELASGIADAVAAECSRLDIPVPHLAFEPGRSIVGNAGITLYRAGTIKDVTVATGTSTAVRRYVAVDGGMSDNLRPALYGADYTARIASRATQAAPVLVRVVGKHCESGDIVVDAGHLPSDVREGDLLAVAATGAYCWELSNNYNLVPRPPVVAVADGRVRVLVHGESEEELLARDAGLAPVREENQ